MVSNKPHTREFDAKVMVRLRWGVQLSAEENLLANQCRV
jgi:hypothetical protein